jgi:hypothetical protein
MRWRYQFLDLASQIGHFGKIGKIGHCGKLDHFGKIGHSSKRLSSIIN